MNALAIDTSGPFAYVALRTAEGKVYSIGTTSSNSHNEELPTLVDSLLAQAKLSPGNLNRIVLGVGPGSFTGLRIGLSYAQGLALSLSIPITAISSLAAYAKSVSSNGSTMVALSDARRDEVFFGAFSNSGPGQFSLIGEERIVALSTLETEISALAAQKTNRVGFAEGAGELVAPKDVGQALLELADLKFGQTASSVFEIADLSPSYLRAVSARTIADRKAN